MIAGFFRGDLTLLDELLDQRVVDGYLLDRPAGDVIATGVADIDQRGLAVDQQCRDERRPHPIQRAVGVDHRSQAIVRIDRRPRQQVSRVRRRHLGQLRFDGFAERFDGRLACDIPGRVPAHPVRDDD